MPLTNRPSELLEREISCRYGSFQHFLRCDSDMGKNPFRVSIPIALNGIHGADHNGSGLLYQISVRHRYDDCRECNVREEEQY
jgi:hypothetical protein